MIIIGKRRYNVKLWRSFTDLFNYLPVAALIDEKILCMHGGLSPDLRNLNQIIDLPRPSDIPDQGKPFYDFSSRFVVRSFVVRSR